ncbi:MAG TPA: glycerol-3-phosphate acyltransferase [Candidatus Egerieimonas intestinavium]|uniref:Glycerol-3-phosphate acyltransferase n=1 Tax=Candidatus Egerieimonas intestinavium TaxID=2840777 RepID=A0A9D1EJU4_9FIRM|nr:glycerol-3-phosphate acyltransferase [Candidatus Egerieimonas intestinavium]
MLREYGFFILLGYLAGGIMFGYLIPRMIKGIDVRDASDDGNPGTANAFLCGGVFCGILVLLADLLKGFLPVYLAGRRVDIRGLGFSLVMAAPVLGHAFPLCGGKGKGGKAIAVSFGVLMGLYPRVTGLWLLIFWYLFFSLVIILNPHRLRTRVTYICWLISSLAFRPGTAVALGNMLIAGIVIDKHREGKLLRLGFGRR